MDEFLAAVLFCVTLPFFLLVVIGYWRLSRRIRALNERMEQVDALLARFAPEAVEPVAPDVQPAATQAARPAVVPTQTPAPSQASPAAEEPPRPAAAPQPTAPPSAALASAAPLPAPLPAPTPAAPILADAAQRTAESPTQAQPRRESLFRSLIEWFTGFHLVVRVGIVLLFIGVALLFRYVVEQGHFPVEMRLLAAGLLGTGLIVVGWRLRFRQPVYALTLQGGGFGIVYMTVFASFRLYQLIPGNLAFGFLLLLVALCMALAVLNDSRALAVLAIGGGFLAPVLASTGAGSHVTLFGYFLILNIGILGVAWFKAWRALNLLGFVFTFVLGFLWGADFYQPAFLASVEPFLVVFFLFYVAIAVLFTLRQPPDLTGFVDGPLVFGTPVVALALQSQLMAEIEYGLAWSVAGAGALYLALALLLRTGGDNFATLRRAFYGLGVILLTLALPLAFSGQTTAYLWAVEGAGLVWLGVRTNGLFNRIFGAVILLGASAMLGVQVSDGTVALAGSSGINPFSLNGLIVSLAAFFSGYLFLGFHRSRPPEKDAGADLFHWLLTLLGLVWWFAALFTQVFAWGGELITAGLLLVVALSSLLGDALSRRLSWPGPRLPWLTLWFLIPVAVFVAVVRGAPPSAAGGWLALPVAFAAHYWILYGWDGPGWQRIYHGLGLWLLALVLGAETMHWIEQLWLGRVAEGLADTLGATLWPLVPALLMAGILWRGESVVWPVARHYRVYVGWLLTPPALALVGWSLYVNTGISGSVGGWLYLPLVNPLGLANLAVLTLLLFWLRRWAQLHFARLLVRVGVAGMLLLAFFWVNVELARMIHHWQGVPFAVEPLYRSAWLQAAYALTWGLLAVVLMFWATRRVVRWVWLLGAALLGLTVLKLFLVDLVNTGTVARIVSFIGVGLLMTAIGYFAPAPPAEEEVDR